MKSVTGYVQTKLLIHPKYPLCFLESINSATHVPMLDIFIRVFRNQTTCEKKIPSLVFLFFFVALVTVHRMNKLAPSSNHQRLLRPPNLYPRRDLRGFQGQNGATRKCSLVCGWRTEFVMGVFEVLVSLQIIALPSMMGIGDWLHPVHKKALDQDLRLVGLKKGCGIALFR